MTCASPSMISENDALVDLHREVNRLFNDMFGVGGLPPLRTSRPNPWETGAGLSLSSADAGLELEAF